MIKRIKACIVVLIFCTGLFACDKPSASLEIRQSEEMSLDTIASICTKLIQDDTFLQFTNAIESDAQNMETVYMIDYGHMEYPNIPDNIHIHKPAVLNSYTEVAEIPIEITEIPNDQTIQAFQRFEDSHGPFDECEHILVNHGEYGTMVAFRISYSVSHRLSTYLVKGDPVNALNYSFYFTDPSIGIKRTMEFVLIADGWYVVCFY